MKEFIVGHVKLLSFIAGGVAAAGVVTGIIIYNNNHLTVTYTLDGKEYEVTENIKKGSILKEPETPTKEGYTFDGWYVDGEKFDFDTEIKGKLELEARFTINKYTITFENSFAESTTETVEWNKKVNKPENPSAYGYTFTGWYLNNELYNFDTPVTGDLTLIAGWYADSVSYTVNHYLLDEEGKSDKVETTVNGTGYVGYTVKAETKDYKGYIKPEEKTMILGYNANVVNYYYPLGEYKVTLEGDNGIESTEGSGTYHYRDIVELSYEIAPGYEFNKYSVEVEDNKYTVEDKDVTIELTTTPIEYKITLNNVEEATFAKENPTTYTIEDEKITLANPTMDGYTFTGWATSEEATSGSMEVVINPSALKDVTYYATWVEDEEKYTIKLNSVEDAIFATANPTTYKASTDTFTIVNPTKEGYTFIGWKDAEESTPQSTYTIEKGTTGNIELTAIWEAIVYSIAYDLNDENTSTATIGTNPTTYTIETDTFTISNPTRPGYVFSGWVDSENAEALTTYTIETGSTGNLSLKATWIEIIAGAQFNVTFKVGEHGHFALPPIADIIEVTKKVTNGNTYTNESAYYGIIADDGYQFDGWYIGEEKIDGSSTVGLVADAVAEARYTKVKFNATFNVGEHGHFALPPIASETEVNVVVTNGKTYTSAGANYGVIADDGYQFDGWYIGETNITGDSVVALTDDVEIIARYSEVN